MCCPVCPGFETASEVSAASENYILKMQQQDLFPETVFPLFWIIHRNPCQEFLVESSSNQNCSQLGLWIMQSNQEIVSEKLLLLNFFYMQVFQPYHQTRRLMLGDSANPWNA